ncbi:hypothetical protein [Agromyces silvae]|uniref:hypothetical protein n=1 Tax=Agromyces silvae TaxID=3388266 RepID=UPI00280B052C|nr:hypothetical protein [Agromyces protaetiae]
MPRTRARHRAAARDAAAYRWQTSTQPPALERVGHSSWLPQLLVLLFTLIALLAVAASWLVPAVVAGLSTGWGTTLDGGPARAVTLSGPAWMYGLIGLVFLAIAVGGVPYVVRETRKHRAPAAILTLAPEFLTVHTIRDVLHGPGARKPRMREAPTAFEWADVEAVEPSPDPEDGRPALVVRRSAAERLGITVGAGSTVRIRIRGDARDVPVLAYFLAEQRHRPRLGSEASARVARRLAGCPA